MDIKPENILENDFNKKLINKFGVFQNLKQNIDICLKH